MSSCLCTKGPSLVFAIPYDPASQTSPFMAIAAKACFSLSQFCQILVLLPKSRNKEKDKFHLCCWSDVTFQRGSRFPNKVERIEFCHSMEEGVSPNQHEVIRKENEGAELGLDLKVLESWPSCTQCCQRDLGRYGPNPTHCDSLLVWLFCCFQDTSELRIADSQVFVATMLQSHRTGES